MSHDQIRGQWKAARQAAEADDPAVFAEAAPALGRALVEMVYKEEKILFPMAMEKLTAEEWLEEKRGEDEIGYLFEPPRYGFEFGGFLAAVSVAVAVNRRRA